MIDRAILYVIVAFLHEELALRSQAEYHYPRPACRLQVMMRCFSAARQANFDGPWIFADPCTDQAEV